MLLKHPYAAKALENSSFVLLNANGAFFVRAAPVLQQDNQGGFYRLSGSRDLRAGSYPGNTLAAQITILLHELGHIVGRLPDDSDELSGQSERNTAEVLHFCRNGESSPFWALVGAVQGNDYRVGLRLLTPTKRSGNVRKIRGNSKKILERVLLFSLQVTPQTTGVGAIPSPHRTGRKTVAIGVQFEQAGSIRSVLAAVEQAATTTRGQPRILPDADRGPSHTTERFVPISVQGRPLFNGLVCLRSEVTKAGLNLQAVLTYFDPQLMIGTVRFHIRR
jgi:hypothetical protein